MNKFRELTDFSGKSSSGSGGINLTTEQIKEISDMEDGEKILEILNNKEKGIFGNMSLGQIAKLYGLGTAGLGLLLDKMKS